MHRKVWLVALLAFAVIAGTHSAPVSAGWEHNRDRPDYHRSYGPYHRYMYVHDDPYRYRPARVDYYPYYNSNQWRPRREIILYRYRSHPLPDYWSSWGYPLPARAYAKRHLRKKKSFRRAHRRNRQLK